MKLPLFLSFVMILTGNYFFNPQESDQFRAVLEPQNQALLSSEVASTVTSIEKRMGETFQKGNLLMQLDDTIFKANVTRNQAAAEKAKADAYSLQQLYKDKAVSLSEVRQAEAELARAQAELVIAQKALEGCTITAPYDGKVIQLYVKEYERVEPGQRLVEILDDRILIAKLILPESLLPQLNIGDSIRMRIDETGEMVEAKVVRIGAVLDPVSSLFKVDAEIVNADGKLRAGMEGRFRPPGESE